MSAADKQWRRRAAHPARFSHPGLPPVVERLLNARGVGSAAEAERFLRADLDGEHDPLLLPDAERALARIASAIREGELIGVFGDYDVDGVTATAILVEGITALGGKAMPRLPDRFTEGYGVSNAVLAELRACGASLVITTDCGISADKEVEFANEIGLDVIVFDHHAIPEHLPDAVALVDPKLEGCAYPCTELAACGISFKMLGALADRLGRPYDPEAHLDLVALGTVCDMAPLAGENRWLVRRGLRTLQRTGRPGLWALAEAGRFELGAATAETLGFYVGPRLNAAGRMANAGVAYELLTTRDAVRARELAQELNRLNARRRQATEQAVTLAQQLLADEPADAPIVIVGHEEIPQGVVGLVAGKLAESLFRPAMVYQRLGDGTCRGSARSIPGFDIVQALFSARELMERCGGHRQAGGFSIRQERMDAVRERLTSYTRERLAQDELVPLLEYDDELSLDEVGPPVLKWLPYLAPHGQGNPEPLFVARGLDVVESRPVGRDASHLRLRLRSASGTIWPAVAFRLAHAAPRTGERIDAAFELHSDRRGRPDLHVRDFAPAAYR